MNRARSRRKRQKTAPPRRGRIARMMFKSAVSAAALAIILLINHIAPSVTKPLSDVLNKGTDFNRLRAGITEYIKKYSPPVSEASNVK
jgi:hypothetical protein